MTKKSPDLTRVGDLEVLRLDASSWRVRDMSAVDAPCPIVGVVDRVDDFFRVTLLDSPADPEHHLTLDDAVRAIGERLAS